MARTCRSLGTGAGRPDRAQRRRRRSSAAGVAMITLAFDTATDRCTVAATDGQQIAHRFVDGARRHAGALLGLIDESLQELNATPAEIASVIMADGPGSFTGLRVAAAVANALA